MAVFVLDENELWISLLEKAFAKLNGSYAALHDLSNLNAMVDLSGNIPEVFPLPKVGDPTGETALFELLNRENRRGTLMSCVVRPEDDIADSNPYTPEASWRNSSFMDSHATFSNEKDFARYFSDVYIFRELEPRWWGLVGRAWQFFGSWSDENKTAGGCLNNVETFPDNPQFLLKMDAPGELMVAISQRQPNLTAVPQPEQPPPQGDPDAIHPLEPAALPAGQPSGTSGSTFATASRTLMGWVGSAFQLGQTATSQSAPAAATAPRAEAAQAGRNQAVDKYVYDGSNYLFAGFVVLRVEDNRKYRVHHRFTYPVAHQVPYYENIREVFGRFTLQPGRYVLFVTTYFPSQAGEFVLRATCSTRHASLRPLTKDAPGPSAAIHRVHRTVRRIVSPPPVWQRPPAPGEVTAASRRPRGPTTVPPHAAFRFPLDRPYPIGVLRVKVVGCTGLAHQKLLGAGADPYCILRFSDSARRSGAGLPRLQNLQSLRPASSSQETLGGSDSPPQPPHASSWLFRPPRERGASAKRRVRDADAGGEKGGGGATVAAVRPPRPVVPRSRCPRTSVARDTLDPEFKSDFLFLVARPADAWLQVEVWNRVGPGLGGGGGGRGGGVGLLDRFMGCAVIHIADYASVGPDGRVNRLWDVTLPLGPLPTKPDRGDVTGKIQFHMRYESTLDRL
ncbi:Calpain-6 [Cladochytrium tenue]|nr:Calpain-6 [Cladochytrium tenue]